MIDDTAEGQALYTKLRGWFRKDREHWSKWHSTAREEYAFVAGDQWDSEAKAVLDKDGRPPIVFNRTDTVIRAVSGMEISNRQEVRYIPRQQGDTKVNEVLTSGAEWFRDQCDAESEESDAFLDVCISGMGWTETRLDTDENPEGDPIIERIDPLEMVADRNARKRNLADARRIWRVRRMPLSEAEEMFPDADPSAFSASWAEIDKQSEAEDQSEVEYTDDGTPKRGDDMVTIVHGAWRETRTAYRVISPKTRSPVTISPERLEKILAVFPGIQHAKIKEKVIREAFLSGEVLEESDAPCPKHFRFQCITGFRDSGQGVWFGLVRGLKDPQEWSNKWLSQTMHIMNSNAKGGVMIEDGSVDDPRKFADSYADPSAVTWVPPGTLTSGAIQPKPAAQFPAGFFQLMQFATESVPGVSGVNVELMGLRDANQPASLEWQRRQAGMSILAMLFDSLRRYRRRQGMTMLYLIQNYLQGRLVRVVQEGNEQFVPMAVEADVDFDVIVADAPTSPNQKERTWSMLKDLMPMLQPLMSPEMVTALAEFSPLPSQFTEKIGKAVEQKQAQGAQAQQMARQEKMSEMQAEAEQRGIEREKTAAELAGRRLDVQGKQVDLEGKKLALLEKQLDVGAQQITGGFPVSPTGA